MYIVIFVTAKDKEQAQKIAQALVQKKLIACANIIEKIESLFWWEKKVDRADEALLILKSRKTLLPKIIKAVKANHTYQVPEIIALPIIGGNNDYLKWIKDSTLKI